MPSRGERILAAEMVGTQIIITGREISKAHVPSPRQYFAGLVVYGGLSGVALLSDQAAEFAAAFGGLVLLATLLTFPGLFESIARAAGGAPPTIVQAPSRPGQPGGIAGALTGPGTPFDLGARIGDFLRKFLHLPEGGLIPQSIQKFIP